MLIQSITDLDFDAHELLEVEFDTVEDLNANFGRFTELFSGPKGDFLSCNFPFPTPEPITEEEKAFVSSVPKGIKYVIGYLKGDHKNKWHAMAHASYYLDESRKNFIHSMYDALSEDEKQELRNDLLQMGYREDRLIDECGAFAVSESYNEDGSRVEDEFSDIESDVLEGKGDKLDVGCWSCG